MTNVEDQLETEMPLEGLLLERTKDRYKISYTALRWAKEIKQKENLPDPIPSLLPRALREILSGKVSIEDVEKLPMIVKVVAQPAQITPSESKPSIKFNTEPTGAGIVSSPAAESVPTITFKEMPADDEEDEVEEAEVSPEAKLAAEAKEAEAFVAKAKKNKAPEAEAEEVESADLAAPDASEDLDESEEDKPEL